MEVSANTPAVVTGGASGLGAATARALAAKGAQVATFDMNAEKGEALAAALGELGDDVAGLAHAIGPLPGRAE